ncbi:MAG: hypothetical protein EOP56_10675 [Sphingobacteriales bacterium]|nr:MAG: hypothetical protein EOP56_10675 [Sphingobacteriales bacterium]
MKKEISVEYKQVDNTSTGAIVINYSMDKDNDALNLVCMVTSFYPEASTWLRMRKFGMRAVSRGKAYMPVFDHDAIDRSVEMSLFIDHAYKMIMKQENITMTA